MLSAPSFPPGDPSLDCPRRMAYQAFAGDPAKAMHNTRQTAPCTVELAWGKDFPVTSGSARPRSPSIDIDGRSVFTIAEIIQVTARMLRMGRDNVAAEMDVQSTDRSIVDKRCEKFAG